MSLPSFDGAGGGDDSTGAAGLSSISARKSSSGCCCIAVSIYVAPISGVAREGLRSYFLPRRRSPQNHSSGLRGHFAVFEFSLGTKWVETLKQISPNLKRVTTIFNPKTAPYYSLYLRAIEKAASSPAIEPIVVEIHDDAEI
jgi:hypothetical protein